MLCTVNDKTRVENIDCMVGMCETPDKFYDVCLTDLPYGVNVEYNTFNDSEENVIELIKKAVPEILRVSKRTIITSGVKLMYYYPKPDWVGCIYSSAGVGIGSHGYCCWQPVLIYGNDPKLQVGQGSHPDSLVWNLGNDKESKFHPVPKPLKMWRRILDRWTNENDKEIFDPFMGSGTTRLAAHDLGLNFTGYELDKDYFEAGNKRFNQHKSQLKLFPV